MRELSPEAAAALASPVVPLCLLIRMDLSSPVFVATAGLDIEWEGHTWVGVATVASIEEVSDTIGERAPLRLTLSSVPNELVAMAMEAANEARGKRCRVYLAIHDPSTYAILESQLIWSGTLDQMTLIEGADGTGQVSVTAEHRAVTFGRPKPLRYTDADQRRLFPGDKALQFIVAQSTHQDIWPSADWGKQ